MERKLLWPDVSEAPVDFMLSIGTGCNGEVLERERTRRQSSMRSSIEDEHSPVELRKKYFFGKLPRFVQILKDRIHNILDTQIAVRAPATSHAL
jgi:hypothetical protein